MIVEGEEQVCLQCGGEIMTEKTADKQKRKYTRRQPVEKAEPTKLNEKEELHYLRGYRQAVLDILSGDNGR